jgi:hypothetical protein
VVSGVAAAEDRPWLQPKVSTQLAGRRQYARSAGVTNFAYGDKAEGRGTIGRHAKDLKARVAGDRAVR